jgi:hypothetical protein
MTPGRFPWIAPSLVATAAVVGHPSLHSHNDTLDVNVTAPAKAAAQFVGVRTQ